MAEEFGRFLAFDTSTERMSVALSCRGQIWQHEGPGGAQSSTTLIATILKLLADAGLAIQSLDAIAFGRGPGSFTGLRTACAVAQGLAEGAGVPVLPVDTLLALAEEARWLHQSQHGGASPVLITALLDARMDEVYGQHFGFSGAHLSALSPCQLQRPEALSLPERAGIHLLAGNAFETYAARWPAWPPACVRVDALPTATALLRLAPGLMAAGQAVDAAQALPLYVRDKVAQTTQERQLAQAAKALLVAQAG